MFLYNPNDPATKKCICYLTTQYQLLPLNTLTAIVMVNFTEISL